ncbi:hypothetical protein SALBM135S_08169 [Streptomyces alboniger]
MRAAGEAKAGPALAGTRSYEYDPAIMRTSWKDGRWGS